MTTTTYDARTRRHRGVTAAELETGDEVYLDGRRQLVARVVPSRSEVMVELWSRGDVEHRAHFFDPAQRLERAVAS